MHLAEELRLPLVTLIDTPGAALSQEAEEGGLAGEIARCLQDLVMLKAPTLAVLLGPGHRRRGAGPGAGRPGAGRGQRLARPAAAGGRVGDRAPRPSTTPARWRRPRACGPPTCGGPGIVDRVVPERPDAADEPTEFCQRLGRVLGEELAGLLGRDDTERFRSRLHRYRHLGR